jgi:NADH:ubiquinone oxidoreductase subunit 3 (subunit A)
MNTPTSGPRFPSEPSTPARSKNAVRWGWGISGFVILFLIFDVAIKLLQLPMAVDATVKLGFPASTVFPMGVIGLVCLILFVIPRTAVVGAVLWTGYLGGAVAGNLRAESPLFSGTLFPIYFAILLWGGLLLRDRRVAAIYSAN